MYSRSEFRHACYRAKKGAATSENRQVLALIEPLMEPQHRWENFASEWDVIVTKDNQVKIVFPEKSYDFIHSTLLKAALYDEMGKSFSDLSDREFNIVMQIEQLMLDGVMTWSNYNSLWGVTLDSANNHIKTVMYSKGSSQIEVSEDMIKASMKDADGNPLSQPETNILETKPMTAEQKQQFEEFLARKYNKA